MHNEDGSMIEPNCLFNYDETNLTDDPGVKKCVISKRSQVSKEDT